MFDRSIAYGLDFHFPSGDDVIGQSLAVYGEFARPISDFLIEHATADDGVFLDVGANVGAIALPFAAARPRWNVLAIEAHRGIAMLLAANAVNNQLSNLEVLNAVAGAEKGVADFPSPPLVGHGNWGTLSMATEGVERTPTLMVALDDIAPTTTRLVKIDVEGYEPHVLQGATRLLRETRPIWLIEAASNHPETSASVIGTLLQAGYSVFWFFAPFATSHSLKGREPPNPGRGDANVVALPPGVANTWGLPQALTAQAKRPSDGGAYPYLERYGMFSGAS